MYVSRKSKQRPQIHAVIGLICSKSCVPCEHSTGFPDEVCTLSDEDRKQAIDFDNHIIICKAYKEI